MQSQFKSWAIVSACAAMLIGFASRRARAEFVNGVEEFNGTSLDAANWEQFVNNGTNPFSQNNALTIDTSHDATYADYTTHTQTVAVGQKMSVDVTVNAYNPDTFDYGGYVFAYLTSNSAGTRHNTEWDDYYLSIKSEAEYTIQGDYGNSQRGFGTYIASWHPQPAGTTYRWEIARLSDHSVRYTVLDEGTGQLINSVTTSTLGDSFYPYAPYPDPLYISFFTEGTSATFDHVTVSDVPEPGWSSVVCFALALTTSFRRRR